MTYSTMNLLRRMPSFVLVAATLAVPGLTSAALINVDFNQDPWEGSRSGTYSGAAVIGTAGDVWNGVEVGPRSPATTVTVTSGVLVDSTGTPTGDGITTGVTVTLTGVPNYVGYDTNFDGQIAFIAPALMNDYAAATTNNNPEAPPLAFTLEFTIDGLTPGGLYNLYLYSQNGGYANGTTVATVNGNNEAIVNAGNIGSFQENVNYVRFLNVVANGSGTIAGLFNDTISSSTFNGFQLQAVPEPSCFALASYAGFGLMTLRRRARNQ